MNGELQCPNVYVHGMYTLTFSPTSSEGVFICTYAKAYKNYVQKAYVLCRAKSIQGADFVPRPLHSRCVKGSVLYLH